MPRTRKALHGFGCTDLCCQPAAGWAGSVSRSLDVPTGLAAVAARGSWAASSGDCSI